MHGEGNLSPVVKWAGGKTQLLKAYDSLFPRSFASYCEPFLGGGAVLFRLRPEVGVVNDINKELILTYTVIQDNVDALVEELRRYRNDKEFFYSVRSRDRDPAAYSSLSDVQKAARLLYLNRTCFNGLYRVNRKGEFNAPFGYYKNPNIVNEGALRAVSDYFNAAKLRFSAVDYSDVLNGAGRGDFVYLDPPYDPVSSTANFTGYSRGGFSRDEQIRLRECCDDLDARGVKFMLSNSATDFILEQYSAYDITFVSAKRFINSAGDRRGCVDEVVIRNYR